MLDATDDTFIKILNHCEYNDIKSLYLTSNHLRSWINFNLLDLEFMPVFRNCNNFEIYNKHYQSFNTGTNFPEEPLWIFENVNDCTYKLEDNKYKKSKSHKYDRSGHYVTSYKFLEFNSGLFHWKLLDNEQKHIIWSVIKIQAPEEINKQHSTEDIVTLLREMFWHYPYSHSRQYSEIYLTDTCSLMDAIHTANIAMDYDMKEKENFDIKSQKLENTNTNDMLTLMNNLVKDTTDIKNNDEENIFNIIGMVTKLVDNMDLKEDNNPESLVGITNKMIKDDEINLESMMEVAFDLCRNMKQNDDQNINLAIDQTRDIVTNGCAQQ